jgi:hypothetical protein
MVFIENFPSTVIEVIEIWSIVDGVKVSVNVKKMKFKTFHGKDVF